MRRKMGFEVARNPIVQELWGRGISNGQAAGHTNGPCREDGPFDNLHQTWKDHVLTPPLNFTNFTVPIIGVPIPDGTVGPGCPECVHMHWRWGSEFDDKPFGGPFPLVYP